MERSSLVIWQPRPIFLHIRGPLCAQKCPSAERRMWLNELSTNLASTSNQQQIHRIRTGALKNQEAGDISTPHDTQGR